jgi:hypothetical protein
MKYTKLTTTIVASTLALSLGLVGCGSNDAAKTDATSSEQTAETTETTAETTETTAETTPEGTAEVTTEEQVANDQAEAKAPEEQAEITVNEEDAAAIAELEETNKGHFSRYSDWYDWFDYYYNDMNSWSVAFEGTTSNGMDLYYAGNAAGTRAALFEVDNASGVYYSYVGDVVDLGNGNFAIVDDYSGRTFYFHTDYADYNGNVYISLGGYGPYGNLGSGVFSPCSVTDVLNIMDAIETYNYSLNWY